MRERQPLAVVIEDAIHATLRAALLYVVLPLIPLAVWAYMTRPAL